MTQWIASRTHPRVKALASLQQRKHRQEECLTIAEGLHLAVEAFAAGAPVSALVVSRRASALDAVRELESRARAGGVEVVLLEDECYAKISALDSPEGVAVTVRVAPAPLGPMLAGAARLLVAAGVQDPGNAGALVRTAEAAGASGCVFLGGVDLSHPRFIRGAQTSSFRVPCAASGEAEFLAALARAKVRLVVADAKQATDYREADYRPPVALAVGGEGRGVSRALVAAASARVSIPMTSPVESLNVAVAAGVLLYEARKHWR